MLRAQVGTYLPEKANRLAGGIKEDAVQLENHKQIYPLIASNQFRQIKRASVRNYYIYFIYYYTTISTISASLPFPFLFLFLFLSTFAFFRR